MPHRCSRSPSPRYCATTACSFCSSSVNHSDHLPGHYQSHWTRYHRYALPPSSPPRNLDTGHPSVYPSPSAPYHAQTGFFLLDSIWSPPVGQTPIFLLCLLPWLEFWACCHQRRRSRGACSDCFASWPRDCPPLPVWPTFSHSRTHMNTSCTCAYVTK